jgi:hypothetical protein
VKILPGVSYENPELFGVNQFVPDFPVSSLVDNIVLLNFVELSHTLRRAITVAKAIHVSGSSRKNKLTIPDGRVLVQVPSRSLMNDRCS